MAVMDLSLSPDHLGWRLQQQERLMEINWVDVPGASTTNAMQLPVDTSNSTFFRLIYP